MVAFQQPGRSSRGRCRVLSPAAVCLVLCLALLPALAGCGGCRKDPQEAEKQREKRLAEKQAQEKEKPKRNVEIIRLATRPDGGQPAETWYKPGHWTGTTLAAKANNFDFLGDLEIAVTDEKEKPVPLPATRFDLTTSREVSLAKGQKPKVVESVLFAPPTRGELHARCRLNWRKGGRRADQKPHDLTPMPSYQYHFVVLARRPEDYTYLGGLTSFKSPSDDFSSVPAEPYYRVVRKTGDRQIALPSYGLLWTSIACVLWDDAEPDDLDPDQQQTLLDWLHWGGQLILSGPGTLDTLSDSFLVPYLPATAQPGARELDKDDFEPLYQWANKKYINKNKSVRPRVPLRPLAGVRLQKHRQGRFISSSGGLLVERRVGRGRIVVSAFRLGGPELTSCLRPDEVDQLFNAFLLRHPPRKFAVPPAARDRDAEGPGLDLQVHWADKDYHRLDAGLISNLRYFARDAGVKRSEYGADVYRSNPGSYEERPPGPGVAAWNEFSPAANAAREALLKAARIEIPHRSFVVWMVAGYLLLLVPLNWAVFRLLGRVEWAWAAAPLIAVACTILVIRMAQLDVGFARSQTEITLVELQADYPRAHVTRYTALYTSLTTSYDFLFEDPGALAQPFPEASSPEEFRTRDRRRILYRRGKDASLLGFHVPSNSTGLVHSEQMVDLGGSLSLKETSAGRFELVNQTELRLHDAGIVKRNESGKFQTAWLGTVERGAMAVQFGLPFSQSPQGNRFWEKERKDPALTGIGLLPGELNLRRLVTLAQDVKELRPGDVRLIARLGPNREIPGQAVEPAAPQSQHAALVVAHLQCGFGDDPEPDENTRKNPEKIED